MADPDPTPAERAAWHQLLDTFTQELQEAGGDMGQLTVRLFGHELVAIELSGDSDDGAPDGAPDQLSDRVPMGFVLPERDGGPPELVD